MWYLISAPISSLTLPEDIVHEKHVTPSLKMGMSSTPGEKYAGVSMNGAN